MPHIPHHALAPPALVVVTAAFVFLVAFLGVGVGDALAQRDGTHFILEGTIGVSTPLGMDGDRVGISTGVTGGFGAKLVGAPLRLYLIGSFDYSVFDVVRGDEVGLARELTEMAGGGRALIALSPHVRVFADGMVGFSWLAAEERGRDGTLVLLVDSDPRATLRAALGVQFRPMMFFSVGVKADVGVILEDGDLPEEEIDGRINMLGTATLHF